MQKELRGEASAIVSFEFLPKTVIEHTRVQEVLRDFGVEATFSRFSLGHLEKHLREDCEMLILPLCEDN